MKKFKSFFKKNYLLLIGIVIVICLFIIAGCTSSKDEPETIEAYQNVYIEEVESIKPRIEVIDSNGLNIGNIKRSILHDNKTNKDYLEIIFNGDVEVIPLD